ncbi:hypothetical protein JOC58_004250 [Paenibacillus hunanensis]|uniref:Uncharacterized protein n=1 Tax=Paenibacillus hunanensis TaxID=539262 RepID=A0ABU1J4H3_9BACL|nr:hypothetical protein [Paenibacillus hunanensis]
MGSGSSLVPEWRHHENNICLSSSITLLAILQHTGLLTG